MESRTQGSKPMPRLRTQNLSRPRTDPLEAKAKDQGHRRKYSPKKKEGLEKSFSSDLKTRSSKNFFRQKRSSKNFYRRFPLEDTKKGLRKFSAKFLALSNKILMVQKIVLFSSREQGNFRGLETSRPTPKTSTCVLENVLEAKDVLEDSTTVSYIHKTRSLLRIVH